MTPGDQPPASGQGPSATIGAAARIVKDVLDYRLRRLEMANLVAAVALMIALRTALPELAFRAIFGLVLNVLAYLINDYLDLEQDLAEGRAPEKTQFLADHRSAARGAQWGLAALLLAVGAATQRPTLLAAVVGGAGLCWLYTRWLKRAPGVDILAMTAWGVTMPLVAIDYRSVIGWLLLGQLGLFSTCFESIQVLRDEAEDRVAGVRTTAVVLGTARTLLLARGSMVLAAAYGSLLIHRYLAPALLIALALPIRDREFASYWNRVRLIFGLVWLGTLAWVFFDGKLWGWVSL